MKINENNMQWCEIEYQFLTGILCNLYRVRLHFPAIYLL
jgi:hypothetical protein